MPRPRAVVVAAAVSLATLVAAATALADAPRASATHHRASRAGRPHRARARRPHARHAHRHHRAHARGAHAGRLAAPTTVALAPRPAPGTRSPGCGAPRPAGPPPGLSEQSVTVRGVARSYLLVLPPTERGANAPLPLVFGFHGRTGTPAAVRRYLRLEPEARGGAIFVYPAGLREPLGDGSGRTVTRWEVGRDGADIALFDAVLDAVGRAHCVDLGRVYAVGHSAGAAVTNELGCQRGNALRAIAPIAGMGPFTARCTAPPPAVWLTHGRADEPVPFRWGEASRDHWVAAARCASEAARVEGAPPACERYAGCDPDASVVFCPHDGDHGPPPFAAREIWRFLSAQH